MDYWKGKSISLRGIKMSDVPDLQRWALDSERSRNFNFIWPPLSEAQINHWIQNILPEKLENDELNLVIETSDEHIVGFIQTYNCNSRDGVFMYRVFVDENHRRNGYATESIRMMIKYFFEELRYQKVNVEVLSDNPASLSLHWQLGFQKEGYIRKSVYTHGTFLDKICYGMTSDEFKVKATGKQLRSTDRISQLVA